MKVNRFSHRQDGSGPIARERLKLMAESAPFEHSPAAARRMKKEISDIISRYFDLRLPLPSVLAVLSSATNVTASFFKPTFIAVNSIYFSPRSFKNISLNNFSKCSLDDDNVLFLSQATTVCVLISGSTNFL